jgi:hypothetical protein
VKPRSLSGFAKSRVYSDFRCGESQARTLPWACLARPLYQIAYLIANFICYLFDVHLVVMLIIWMAIEGYPAPKTRWPSWAQGWSANSVGNG